MLQSLLVSNEKLQTEKQQALHELDELRKEVVKLQKICNKYTEKEALVSKDPSNEKFLSPPLASSECNDQLICQNILLRKQLENQCTKEEIVEKLELNDLQNTIDQYIKLVEQKNVEIAMLSEKCNDPQLRKKNAHLQNLLKKTQAANQIFGREIGSLNAQLMQRDNQGSSLVHNAPVYSSERISPLHQIQAVIDTPSAEKTDDLKMKLEEAKLNLDRTIDENTVLCDQMEGMQSKMRELNDNMDRLKKENSCLKEQCASQPTCTDCELYNAQMKVFRDDFDKEREDKEKLAKDNQKLLEKLSFFCNPRSESLSYPSTYAKEQNPNLQPYQHANTICVSHANRTMQHTDASFTYSPAQHPHTKRMASGIAGNIDEWRNHPKIHGNTLMQSLITNQVETKNRRIGFQDPQNVVCGQNIPGSSFQSYPEQKPDFQHGHHM